MTSSRAHPPRPPRPVPYAKRVEAFVTDVIEDALADGFVERCAARAGAGQGYQVTPKGEEWLRSLPPWALDCAPRGFRPACGRP